MPMDPENTVDMVGAPKGSSTGQTWSQELMFRDAIMKTDLTSPFFYRPKPRGNNKILLLHALNSVDGAMEHDRFAALLQLKYGENSIYCPMCLRLYPRNSPEWLLYSRADALHFVRKRWEKPPYQAVVEQALLLTPSKEKELVSLCQHCACFIRKNWYAKKKNKTRPTIPMWTAVQYIVSGGCTTSPSATMLRHCIESLLHNFPQNPILLQSPHERCSQTHRYHDNIMVLLYDRMQMVYFYLAYVVPSFQYVDEEILALCNMPTFDFLAFLRWMAEGSHRLLVDSKLAHRMRKFTGDCPAIMQWWEQTWAESPPCRHCARGATYSTMSAFSTVLLNVNNEEEMAQRLHDMEKEQNVVDCITAFCSTCHAVSTLSFEYDCMLKNTMALPCFPTADAYYSRLLHIFHLSPPNKKHKSEKK